MTVFMKDQTDLLGQIWRGLPLQIRSIITVISVHIGNKPEGPSENSPPVSGCPRPLCDPKRRHDSLLNTSVLRSNVASVTPESCFVSRLLCPI